MAKYTTVVFDLDDTLFPEREFVRSGFAAVGAWMQVERGVVGLGAAAWRRFEAGERKRAFDDALAELGAARELGLVEKLVGIYRDHRPQIALFPEAAEVLDTLRGRYRLGLLTDGYAGTQRRKIAALGIEPLFDKIVVTDELGRENWKPSRVPFQMVMESLGCDGGECVYIGDNPKKDFLAPNELGWLTIQIRRAVGEYEKENATDIPPGYCARHRIMSLRVLPELLERSQEEPTAISS